MTDAAIVPTSQKPASPGVFAQAIGQKLAFWIALLMALIGDIASKAWADINIRPMGDAPVSVIPHVLAWKWAENKGAAFSILDGRADLLSIIAVFVLLVVFAYMYRTDGRRKFFLVALGMVAAGAVGNVYDRLLLGHVRDFILFDFDLPFYGKFSFIPQRWPVFNVADMSILCGVAVLVLLSFKSAPKAASTQEKP